MGVRAILGENTRCKSLESVGRAYYKASSAPNHSALPQTTVIKCAKHVVIGNNKYGDLIRSGSTLVLPIKRAD
eukprot:16443968-Heterocapsa_arctica.AAC.1